MRRLVAIVSIASFILVGSVAVSAWPRATAQETTVATDGHPLAGAWFWENISDDPFDDSYAILHADGTYVEETAYIGAGIGAWQATGERTGDLLIVFQDIDGGLDPNRPAAFVAGSITFWLSLEVDATGDALTATGPVEVRSPDGALVDQFVFNGTATRLGVGLVKPVATPTS